LRAVNRASDERPCERETVNANVRRMQFPA
jgi:hypothetical protein